METVLKQNVNGGKGPMEVKYILNEEERNGTCNMYAQVTLGPGCTLGYHEHVQESETYYIIRGTGDYNDNGTIRPVTVGDRTFTPGGCGHGIANTGDGDLVFMALILPY